MKLTQVRIMNYRSCRDVSIEVGDMHALVGANNAGKSTVLRALDFLFNPSTRQINEEAFWNKDTSQEIRIEAIFTDLSDYEKEALSYCLKPDGSFHMARSAKYGDDKIEIAQHYKQLVPTLEWLQDSNITGAKITEWWGEKDTLIAGSKKFLDFTGWTSKPTVGTWKEQAKRFIEDHADIVPMEEVWIDNPKGYAGVLKGVLPFYVLVPAVRDVTEESKGTKSSPFGKLLYAILDSIAEENRSAINDALGRLSRQMNRTGGADRVPLIAATEKGLNEALNDLFAGCDLEIEFETPTLEILLNSPKLYVDDGFRNAVENKGHGLQRAVIFSILRCYADHMTASYDGKKKTLILGVEEPELYMHPQAQRSLRKVFRKIASGGDQVLFTTHSALLVDVAYFDEIIRMESTITNDRGGKKTVESYAWQLSMARMIDDVTARIPQLRGQVSSESIREHYSHVYNPRRSEGFFASKIILVEGITEEYSLPIYADAIDGCSFDPHGISVVECGGKGSMDRLYRIFNELHIPCYVLFDYDDGNTDSNIIAKSRELLEMFGEPTDVPSDLFISDTVACFRTTWEKTLKDEISDIDAIIADSKKQMGPDIGKPLQARYIAKKVTAQTPPIVPPSLKKIIQQAVQVTWKQSCLHASEAVTEKVETA